MEIDFEQYAEMNNQAMGQLSLVLGNQNKMIKKVKEESVKSAVDATSLIVDGLTTDIKLIRKDYTLLASELKDTKSEVKTLKDDYANLTQTFLMNPREKRKFDKHISSLTYYYTIKDSICDRLFHGDITRACKGHIVESLDVSSVNFIRLDTVETTKVLAKAFLKPYTVINIIKKKMNILCTKNNSKVGLKPEIKSLYDAYLEETNGGNNIHVGIQ